MDRTFLVGMLLVVTLVVSGCGTGSEGNESAAGLSTSGVSACVGTIDSATVTQHYNVPTYKTKNDFANVIYIDPTNSNGDGTIENPYNTIAGLPSIQSNTAYLIKAGTTLDEHISVTWNNNYVGRYGEGEMPILTSSITPLSLAGNNSSDVVFENLHFTRAGNGNYGQVVRFPDGGDHGIIVFANNKVIGMDTGLGYPSYCIKGSAINTILYHNEFSYSQNDGIYGGNYAGSSIVSNWFHHNNMGGVASTESTGDSFQMENAEASGVYIANNYMDRSHTIWKFALVINSLLELSSDVVTEWNTFVAPRTGNGGAAVRWLAGTDNKFNKNLLDTQTGIPGIAGWTQHVNQDPPYGARDNHFVGSGDMWVNGDDSGLDPTNLPFETCEDYATYLSENKDSIVTNAKGQYGSDLDTDKFWRATP